MHRTVEMLALAATLIACSKKSATTEVKPEPPVASASASASVEIEAKTLAFADATSETTPTDDAVDGDFTLAGEMELGEGKTLPTPKFKPCSKEMTQAHVAAVQAAFDAQVAQKCYQTGRFNASFVPATYILCAIAMSGDRLQDYGSDHTRMVSIEGTNVNVTSVSVDGWELWNTPRGYFLDLGDGVPVYVVRQRTQTGVTCLGKKWTAEGEVSDVALPHFPTRGRDVDGDGKPEFPDAVFRYAIDGWKITGGSAFDTACDETEWPLKIDVAGIAGDTTFASFEQHELAAANARAKKLRLAISDKPRKKGDLRMTNACALDAAQIAAELFVHARNGGASAEAAIVDADAVMKDLAVKLGECKGVESTGKVDPEHDHWPDIRAKLLTWKPQSIAGAQPSAAPSASASASASAN